MKLFRTTRGVVLEKDGRYIPIAGDWDELINADCFAEGLASLGDQATPRSGTVQHMPDATTLLPPIGQQEVWAAGVTYYRSRDARMEESREAGADDFYARVYVASRPELFFKSNPHRVVGEGQEVRIRKDSHWNVPEPELALVINSRRDIIGYTIGNDMSSRDIEGENPLYLPQAKVYDASCALGPGMFVAEGLLSPETIIRMSIQRQGDIVFEGETSLAQLKRSLDELVEYLYRETHFPLGCILLTGTGIVPPPSFTLAPKDQIQITIPPIGTLSNTVARERDARRAE